MRQKKREFTLNKEYFDIDFQTVYGKIIQNQSWRCTGRYLAVLADKEGIYYLAPESCGGDVAGGLWVSNDPNYKYLHHWLYPKKVVFTSQQKQQVGLIAVWLSEISDSKIAVKKNPTKMISSEFYQDLVDSIKTFE